MIARLIAVALVFGSLAGPPARAEEVPLFQCRFANGKAVSLIPSEAGLIYRFGRPDRAPELQLERSYADLEVTPWPGVGRSIWEDLSLSNDGYTYRIWGALDKFLAVEDDPNALSAGLTVEQSAGNGDRRELARLDCLPESITYTVFDFEDFYTAAGYCWKFSERGWGRGVGEACQ